MTWRLTRLKGFAQGLMLLGALLLFAAPALSAAMPKDECCAEMPCPDQDRKASCPEACAVACQVIVAPEHQGVGPVEIDAAPMAPVISPSPPGRALAPELPPPR